MARTTLVGRRRGLLLSDERIFVPPSLIQGAGKVCAALPQDADPTMTPAICAWIIS
jgi:hypothetical protein